MFLRSDAESADEKAVADGILGLSVDLLKTLHKEDENLIFSPFSISAALSLAYLGAAGSTRDEIGKLLGSSEKNIDIKKYHKNICKIMESVIVESEEKPRDAELDKSIPKSMKTQIRNHEKRFNETIVSLANGIFMQEHLNVKPSYLNDAATLYKSEVTKVDFQGDRIAAKEKMNGWVSEKTKARIPQLFDAPLSTDTLVILVNTLYFVSPWSDEFLAAATQVETFFTGKEKIKVPMMRKKRNVPYLKNKSLQFEAISLRYSERGYRMFIILPFANQSLQNLIHNLKLKDLQQILTQADTHTPQVDYRIPRFKFSTSLSLKDTLSKLGMNEAFDKADFSNMLEDPIQLDEVKHAAEIEIDEKGTTASAATAVMLCGSCFNPQPIQFHANRPFMALIHHEPTSTILFSATVYQPNVASFV